jgi:sec-independent protein translocase protein TatA
MNFMGMGPMELMVILVIAIIIFGPNKIPELGAQVGKGIRDFNRARQQLTQEVTKELDLDDTKREFQALKSELTQTFKAPAEELAGIVKGEQAEWQQQKQEVSAMLSGSGRSQTSRAGAVAAPQQAGVNSGSRELDLAARRKRAAAARADAPRPGGGHSRRSGLNQP